MHGLSVQHHSTHLTPVSLMYMRLSSDNNTAMECYTSLRPSDSRTLYTYIRKSTAALTNSETHVVATQGAHPFLCIQVGLSHTSRFEAGLRISLECCLICVGRP